jgi:hypothetical protein
MRNEEKDAREKESAARKVKLAGQLDSEPMLIACARFYQHHLRIKGDAVIAALLDSFPMPYYPWKHHAQAMRRVMGVKRKPRYDGELIYQVPDNLELRVKYRIGLEMWTTEFRMLKPALVISKEIESFARAHSVLASTICFLMQGEEQVAVREAEQKNRSMVNPNTGQVSQPVGLLNYMPADLRHRLTRNTSRR